VLAARTGWSLISQWLRSGSTRGRPLGDTPVPGKQGGHFFGGEGWAEMESLSAIAPDVASAVDEVAGVKADGRDSDVRA